ncbi:MAG: conjugal transfer protein TrbL [Aeromicrobium sp.]|nr:conjugal transfer protein TrbL [Aeromicrobium sp.]
MGVCDVPVVSKVCNVAGEAAGSLVSAPFDWLANATAGAAQWMFEHVWEVFDTTTRVDVQSGGYVSVYNILFGVAIFIVAIFFCFQLIGGVIARDPSALTRAGIGVAKSILGSFLVITLTATLLEVVDQLCIGVVAATGSTMEELGAKIAALVVGLGGISIAAPGVGPILTIFLSGLAVSAAAIVWFSLLIRKALLLVAIVLAPIALSGSSWDVTRGWFSKWASFVIALIVSKLVVVVIFLVAVTQVASPIDLDLASIGDPIAGIALMFLAGFAPYMAYKFISFMGFDAYHAMGAEQEAKHALDRPMPMRSQVPKVLGANSNPSSDGGKGGSAPVPSGGGDRAGGGQAAAAAGPEVAAAQAGIAAADKVANAGPTAGHKIAEATDSASAGGAPPPSSAMATSPPLLSGAKSGKADLPGTSDRGTV